MVGLGTTLSLISKVTGVKNFTYTAKIIPQKIGAFGINARIDGTTNYGYYLDLGGIGTGSWRFYKYGKMMGESPVVELDSGGLQIINWKKINPYGYALRHLTAQLPGIYQRTAKFYKTN